MFECQILRTISHPLSILLAIKPDPFGLAFGLAPSFIDTYDNCHFPWSTSSLPYLSILRKKFHQPSYQT